MELNIDELCEAWEQLVQTLKDVVEGIRTLIEDLQEEFDRQKTKSDPRTYGMSLVRLPMSTSERYLYIPVVRKHLPYQRRKFERDSGGDINGIYTCDVNYI